MSITLAHTLTNCLTTSNGCMNKIHGKRNSSEVTLTLDVLKAGKRFHATVSFDSDTGEIYSSVVHCMGCVYKGTVQWALLFWDSITDAIGELCSTK